jgi:predicted enzyme related to lactoylglutathione lyase
LGFTVAEQWGPYLTIVAREDLQLWLSGPQTSAARPMPDGRQPEPGGWNRIQLPVDDLASEVERLRKTGAHFRNDIVTGMGGKQILLDDPAGNPIELFEPPRR